MMIVTKFSGFSEDGRRLYLKGGGGGGTTTTVTQNFSPEEAARRTQVMDEAQRIYNASKSSMSSSAYPGPRVTPFSPESLLAQQGLTQYALGPAAEQANAMSNAVKFGLSDVLYPQTNPALQETIAAGINPILEQYFDPGGVMSNIRSSAINAGQYGGSRQGIAEGVAAGRLGRAIGDTAAKIATEGYGKGLDTFSRTLAFAPQAMQSGTLPMQLLSAVGSQKESLEQAIEDYNANARMWGLNAPWLPLQNYANIVFGGASPGTTSTSNLPQAPRPGFAGALGGAAAGWYLGSQLATGTSMGSIGGPIGAGIGALLSLML